MGKVIVYGAQASVCTRRVLLVLKEKKIEYEFVPVNLAKGEQKTAEYRERQPFGVVPVLVGEDGFTIFESRAIARYLDAKYSQNLPHLMPKGLKETALFEQAAGIEISHFDPLAAAINFERRLKKNKGLGEPDEVKLGQLVTDLCTKLDVYEKLLSRTKYLAGDELSLVDLFHLPLGTWVETWYPDMFSSRTNVNHWWTALKTKPSWVAISEGQT